jgi:hypothetical protein
MQPIELAVLKVRQVWLNAGDADGSADAALNAIERANLPMAIEAMELVMGQAQHTARLAAKTLDILKAITPTQ